MSGQEEQYFYTVSLTHEKSGETVEFTEDNFGYGSPVFLWTDGNYSCNCNRYLFFERAKGTDEEDFDDRKCGEYDNYRLNFIRRNDTGETLYRED